jgi:hypothetical protein
MKAARIIAVCTAAPFALALAVVAMFYLAPRCGPDSPSAFRIGGTDHYGCQ